MISTDAAALIAQVYPVGVLILALEARGFRIGSDSHLFWRIFFALLAVIAVLAIFGGIASVVFCIGAVSENVALVTHQAVIVTVSGYLLSFSVTALLAAVFAKRLTWDNPNN